jgi:hypothetical protein
MLEICKTILEMVTELYQQIPTSFVVVKFEFAAVVDIQQAQASCLRMLMGCMAF